MKVKQNRLLFSLVFSLLLTACVKHREFVVPVVPKVPFNVDSIVPGVIKINEFIAKGSINNNEFGTPSDWIELYNLTDSSINITSGKWYITDTLPDMEKFQLPIRNPAIVIPPNGFVVIWCDDLGDAAGQSAIHTTFKLGSASGAIGLYYKASASSTPMLIDGFTYGTQQSGVSNGRKPDGSNGIVILPNVTPGGSNN